jgi:3-dehydroquinate synthase
LKKNRSPLIFSTQLPSRRSFGAETLLIYDQFLESSPAVAKWIAGFPHKYGVTSGEDLKSVESFPAHIRKIMSVGESLSSRQMIIVVLGGGSVGDFGSFVASIFKRGVRLVQIPSTWLAAIDSAHGGKTALNVGGVKNQIGTFYPAEKIYLVKNLLLSQPNIRAQDAFSEIYKVALLQGGAFWQSFAKGGRPDGAILWKFLKPAIAAKYKVVDRDPLEKTGHRHLLNFGHSLGHVLESLHQLPHGTAINYGLEFALVWSQTKKFLKPAMAKKIFSAPASQYLLSPGGAGLLNSSNAAKMKSLLEGDKKKVSSQKMRFIFCRAPGKCFIQEVTFSEILAEVSRQSSIAHD